MTDYSTKSAPLHIMVRDLQGAFRHKDDEQVKKYAADLVLAVGAAVALYFERADEVIGEIIGD